MLEDVSTRLADKLITLYDSLPSEQERFHIHLLMSVAMGGLAPRIAEGRREIAEKTWDAGIKVISHMNPAGLAYIGDPRFVREEYLSDLITESRSQGTIAHRAGNHELAPGGDIATKLSTDQRLISLVSESIGLSVEPSLISSYLFYNKEGDYLYPHVDTEIFAINCIVMLEHTIPSEEPDGSALIVYPPGKGKTRLHLQPGEIVIILASGTVHGREEIKKGEHVVILTIGFQAKANT